MAPSYTIKVPTIHGDMLINRFDINQTNAIVKTGAALDYQQIDVAQKICYLAGEGSVMLDIGANFGAYALSCAKTLKEKGGAVHAFEGQRILAYMICGSTVLNSIENLFVHHNCVGDSHEEIPIPKFDYSQLMNFGSIEFGDSQNEELHQKRSTSHEVVQQVKIDDFSFEKVCFIKIDVEGMESQVLNGAKKTIGHSLPVLQIEVLKSDLSVIISQIKEISPNYIICQYGPYDILCFTEDKMSALGINKNNIDIVG